MADKSDKSNKLKARLPRGLADRGPAEIAATRRMIETIRAGLRALRLRAGGDAGDRIHRRARQIPARPGPAERGRVLVPGRRRAVAVACATTSPRRSRATWRRISTRCRSRIARYRYGWVFRNEKPGPGRFRQFMQFDADTVGSGVAGGRRRDVHDGGGHDGGAGHSARQLCGEGEQPQGARRRDGGDRTWRRGERRQAAHRAARDRQVGPARRRTACASCSARAARTRAAISPRAPGLDDDRHDRIRPVTARDGLEVIRPQATEVTIADRSC